MLNVKLTSSKSSSSKMNVTLVSLMSAVCLLSAAGKKSPFKFLNAPKHILYPHDGDQSPLHNQQQVRC